MSSGADTSRAGRVPNGPDAAGNLDLLPLTVEEQAAILAAVFARSPDGMLYISPDGVVRAVNASSAQQTRLHPGGMIGRSPEEVFPSAKDRIGRICEEVRETGKPFQAEAFSFEFKDQPERGLTYWDLSISPLYGTDGAFLGYLVLHREVTKRQRAEEERQRLPDQLQAMNQRLAVASMRAREQAREARRQADNLEATITSITDGVLIYGSNGEIERMNPAAERILGYSEAELQLPLSRRMAMLAVETLEGEPFTAEELPPRRAMRGEMVQGVVMAIRTAGRQPVWVSASAGPIRGAQGELLGAVVTFTDITALRESQEQREEFLHRISHDLRNSLTAVTVQAELLHRRLMRQGLEQDAEIAQAILESGRRMGSMIADLVEVDRLETGHLELHKQTTDLGRLVTDLAGRVGTMEDRAHLQVEAQEGMPPVVVDPERVERAIEYLIMNALAQSPPDALVVVRLVESDGEILVSVVDRGPGIPTEDVPHLFERFYRPRTGVRAPELSLGLYLARLIVEAHGGSIWAESEVGQGTTIFFTLPVG
ncbi:MAG: PAS domain-containing protein [Bacteroidetes bacterium]|nr:PAS domain-containing protein [Bacteroidota bacterium]MCL5025142.1 PAS domain-containing protein [Chloroflexota bacterium]